MQLFSQVAFTQSSSLQTKTLVHGMTFDWLEPPLLQMQMRITKKTNKTLTPQKQQFYLAKIPGKLRTAFIIQFVFIFYICIYFKYL